jgi:hypothetical protein
MGNAQAGNPEAANDNTRRTSFTAADLQYKVFPPIKWIVPGYICEGTTIFAGRPKIGKSWLVLDAAIAVATGGTCLGGIKCEQGDVLYLALEDNERRLKSRLDRLMPYMFPRPRWPTALCLETEWPRADFGGLAKIEAWLDEHPNARLVIIDVLAMFRPLQNARQNAYEQDYAAIKSLQAITSKRNVGLVVVTHVRKAASESGDPFERVSGTMGQTGGADAALIIDRTSKGAVLYARGRDIEEIESAVMFDKLTCKWRVLGEAAEVRRSSERESILAILAEADEPLTPSKIAALANMPRGNVDRLLGKMFKEGEVEKTGRGLYSRLEPEAVAEAG